MRRIVLPARRLRQTRSPLQRWRRREGLRRSGRSPGKLLDHFLSAKLGPLLVR